MRNKIKTLFLSKDRAMQLYASIESFLLNCLDAKSLVINILYKVTTEKHSLQYEELKKIFGNIEFIEERDFAIQIIKELKGFDYIFMQGDDNISVGKFWLEEIVDCLKKNRDALGFSLRLGKNINYCYMSDSPQKFPSKYEVLERDVLKYNWTIQTHDFGYPFEETASIYRTEDILPILHKWNPNHPISYEGCLSVNAKKFKNSHPYLLCLKQSVIFSLPINTFRVHNPNIRSGEKPCFSIDALAGKFDDKMKINIKPFQMIIPYSPHQEVWIDFVLREE